MLYTYCLLFQAQVVIYLEMLITVPCWSFGCPHPQCLLPIQILPVKPQLIEVFKSRASVQKSTMELMAEVHAYWEADMSVLWQI